MLLNTDRDKSVKLEELEGKLLLALIPLDLCAGGCLAQIVLPFELLNVLAFCDGVIINRSVEASLYRKIAYDKLWNRECSILRSTRNLDV